MPAMLVFKYKYCSKFFTFEKSAILEKFPILHLCYPQTYSLDQGDLYMYTGVVTQQLLFIVQSGLLWRWTVLWQGF